MTQTPDKGANFIGKWVMDTKKIDNFVNFMKASGLDDEDMIAKFKDVGGYVIFTYKGDNLWNCRYKTDLEMVEKDIDFTPGKEVTTEFEGKGLKFTFTFDEDNVMTEVQKLEITNWTPVTIKRTVTGDVIEGKHTVNGTTMTTVLNRERAVKG